MFSNLKHIVLLFTLLSLSLVQISNAESTNYVARHFLIDVTLCSYVPNGGIEEHDQHGSGMATAGSILGLGLRIKDVRLSVDIKPRLDDGRFLVSINLEPEDAKQRFGFKKREIELTTLEPTAVRLATSKQGHVYQLNFTPSVRVTDNTPRPLDVNTLRFHNWRLPSSPILVKDAMYVGRISSSNSPVAFVDISDVARAEFSLHHLTNATPSGVLHKGIVTLTHPDDQTNIQISNVRNGGPHSVDLPGGPYRV